MRIRLIITYKSYLRDEFIDHAGEDSDSYPSSHGDNYLHILPLPLEVLADHEDACLPHHPTPDTKHETVAKMNNNGQLASLDPRRDWDSEHVSSYTMRLLPSILLKL